MYSVSLWYSNKSYSNLWVTKLWQIDGANKSGGDTEEHSFTFDRVFGPESSQIQVFEEIAAPVVDGKNF